MARATAVVVVLLAALTTAPPTAQAVSRKQAKRIALTTLRPLIDPQTVRLYGLRRPLSARQSVQVFTGRRQRLRRRPLGRAAWIYWLDLAHGAHFEHPSVLLLIDDRTGRVRMRRKLAWYPLIDGRRPPFLQARARAWTSATREPATAPAQGTGYAIRPEHLAKDCLIAIGDRGDPATPEDPIPDTAFVGDLEAMEGFADKIGLRRFSSQASARGLERTVERAVADGCSDVFIFLAGHGTPGRGVYHAGGKPERTRGGPAGVKVATRKIGRRPESRQVLDNEYIRPTDLERIVDAQRGKADFKIKIMSCFAGRFFFALSEKPNVRVLELSSQADEASYGYMGKSQTVRDDQGRETLVENDTPTRGVSEFVDRNLFGLEAWASSPQEAAYTNFDLPAGIALSFELGAHRDFSAKIGWTHPILVYR